MEIDLDLLGRVCEAPGAPGFEKPIRDLVLSEVKGLADDIRVDAMGNVVALVKGASSEKKTMAAAHMDEIGFIVNFFIDTGLPAGKVKELIEIGDSITRERSLVEMGDCVNVKSLDNRVSVYLLIETLKVLKGKTPTYDFYAVFTVQEEVGLRGANTSALEIQPDFAFGLDTTIAYDVPGSKPQERCTSLGKGVGIKIMDSSVICDRRMVAYMKDLAEKESITWQPEILAAGGTDTAGMQRMSPGGSIAGAVSIPTRNIHQVIEMSHKGDIAAGIQLLASAVCNLDSWDWTP